MNLTVKQKKALHNAIEAVEKVVSPTVKKLDHFFSTPHRKVTIESCRDFAHDLVELDKAMMSAGVALQRRTKEMHTKINDDKKSSPNMIYNGLHKLAHANTCIGVAIVKAIHIIKLELSPKAPQKEEIAKLKKAIKVSLKDAEKSFKKGMELVTKGTKLANQHELVHKKPSKAAMVFHSLKRHMSGHTKHTHAHHGHGHQHKKHKPKH
jgi:hypothetical protein